MTTKRGETFGTLDEIVGRNVRLQREKLDLSQQALGDEVGGWLGRSMPKQVVSKIERGTRTLDVVELLAFAYVLEMPVQLLLRPDLLEAQDDDEVVVGEGGWTPTVSELHGLVLGSVAAEREAQGMRELLRQSQDLMRATEAMQRIAAAGVHTRSVSAPRPARKPTTKGKKR